MGKVISDRFPWGGLVAAVIGGVVGAIVGFIVSANYVISVVGHPDGAEASIADVFQQDPFAGVVDALFLIGGPVMGAWLGWRVHGRVTR